MADNVNDSSWIKWASDFIWHFYRHIDTSDKAIVAECGYLALPAVSQRKKEVPGAKPIGICPPDVCQLCFDSFTAKPVPTHKPVVIALSGVTYEGRSTSISRLKPNEHLQLVRRPNNAFDVYAIECLNQSGASLGWIPKEIAKDYALFLDQGDRLYGKVISIVGGYGGGSNLGVRVLIGWSEADVTVWVREPRESVRDRKIHDNAGKAWAEAQEDYEAMRDDYLYEEADSGPDK